MEHVLIRGSKVRSVSCWAFVNFALLIVGFEIVELFIITPDMLNNAPMSKRLDAEVKGKSAGGIVVVLLH